MPVRLSQPWTDGCSGSQQLHTLSTREKVLVRLSGLQVTDPRLFLNDTRTAPYSPEHQSIYLKFESCSSVGYGGGVRLQSLQS